MVSNASLKKQIANQRRKIAIARERQEDELEKIRLQQELKVLQRSPSTSRNIKLAKRTGRGFKVLSQKAGKILLKQGKLIRDQQLRNEAKIDKRLKKGPETVIITKTITGKGKKRKVKVSRRKIKSKSKKTKQTQRDSSVSDSIFGGLDF